MQGKENNFAFIDSNNLKLDFRKFRVYLSDGDFYCLINYLYEKNKLKRVVSPNYKKCSALLKKATREKIDFLDYQRSKFARK